MLLDPMELPPEVSMVRGWAAVGTQATVFCVLMRSKAQEWGMKMSSDPIMIFPTTERIPSLGGVHDDSSLPT